MTADSLARLAAAPPDPGAWLAALVALHGALPASRADAMGAALGSPATSQAAGPLRTGAWLLDPTVGEALVDLALREAEGSASLSLADLRATVVAALRRRVTLDRVAAARGRRRVDRDAGRRRGGLVRDGERVLLPGRATGPTAEVQAAMSRLETALAVPAPPSLSEAARTAGCPPDAVRALEASGRITRVEDDLAWATPTLHAFEELAVRLASPGPLAPAAFRDATGTSRRYALAILEDLDRRGILRRTADGHVPGPRAGSVAMRA